MKIKLCASIAMFLTLCSPSYADSIGARGGVSVLDTNTQEDFNAYELFLVFDLPWAWQQQTGSRIQTQLELTGGMLDAAGETGSLVTLGPRIAFITDRVSFDVGVGVAAVGQDRFGDHNFGGTSQFTAQAGLDFALTRRFNAGVRIRHMSDAKTHDNGQDLNLVLVELSYDFHEEP